MFTFRNLFYRELCCSSCCTCLPLYYQALKTNEAEYIKKNYYRHSSNSCREVWFVILDLYISIPAYVNNNQTICLLQSPDNDTNFSFGDNIYLYSQVTSNCINSLGVLLTVTCSFEFIFAQAPHRVCGMLIRVWFSIKGIYAISGWMMIKPFKAARDYLIPSCELYVLIMNFIFICIIYLHNLFREKREVLA